MRLIYLDYYQFKRDYPKEAEKLERTSELFEKQRRIDIALEKNKVTRKEDGDDCNKTIGCDEDQT